MGSSPSTGAQGGRNDGRAALDAVSSFGSFVYVALVRCPGVSVFASGLNVIEGASDTGKSYALSCIDFVMGAGTPPEEIPQSRQYDVAYLCIQAGADGQFYTLKRALVGGKIGLFRGRIDDALGADAEREVLGETTNAKESVSASCLACVALMAGESARTTAG